MFDLSLKFPSWFCWGFFSISVGNNFSLAELQASHKFAVPSLDFAAYLGVVLKGPLILPSFLAIILFFV